MLHITIDTKSLSSMLAWLKEAKQSGIRDEKKLREILCMDAYRTEFARYGMEGLPVCGIAYEEAVDFFLHFDEKDFENERLQMKKASFIGFYENMEADLAKMTLFSSFTDDEMKEIETLLENALPQHLLKDDIEMTVLLTVSIGNSFGWVYENCIDFDVANLGYLEDKQSLLHLIAHEIHHSFFERLIPEDMKPQEYFLVNFAYEGLAVHFMNNRKTVHKPAKYDGPSYCMVNADMDMYESEFDALFEMFRNDYKASATMTMEEVETLIGDHYEQFTYISLKDGTSHAISQYPTYYLGCYFYGLIDLQLGKEALFEALAHPQLIKDTYNRAVSDMNLTQYIL